MPRSPQHHVLALALLAWVVGQAGFAAEGMLAEYFPNPNLTGLPSATAVVPQPGGEWGVGSPAGLPRDNFSIRYTGRLVSATSGGCVLTTIFDDGCRLWAGDRLLINDWSRSGRRSATAALDLVAGQALPLAVEFVDRSGNAAFGLSWAWAGQPATPIPVAALRAEGSLLAGGGSGFAATYCADENLRIPVLRRVDPGIAFAWGSGSPTTAVPVEHFSASWLGLLRPRFSESTTLILTADDGVRAWVDGDLLIDAWSGKANSSQSASFAAVAGVERLLRIEYREITGSAGIKLEIAGPNEPRRVLPAALVRPFTGLKVALPKAAQVSPCFIEGFAAPAVEPRVTVGGRRTAVTRLAETVFTCDLPLSASRAVPVVLRGGSDRVAGSITWTPTPLDADQELTLRQGDSLLLAAEEAKVWRMLDGSGLQIPDEPVPAARWVQRFDRAGHFTLEGLDPEGVILGRVAVTVVSVELPKRLACEVGYTRSVSATAVPGIGEVTFIGNDAAVLQVVAPVAQDAEGQVLRLGVKPLRRGLPCLLARINGPRGPVVALREIDEFTVDIPFRKNLVLTLDEETANTSVVIKPWIPDLWLRMDMFAHRSTFAGGLKSISKSTSPGVAVQPPGAPPVGEGDFVQERDPLTGELIGRYRFRMEIPINEDRSCVKVAWGQVNSPWVDISSRQTVNACHCKVRSFASLILPHEKAPDPDASEEWESSAFAMLATEKAKSCCSYVLTAPHKKIDNPPQPCDGLCGTAATMTIPLDEPGKYVRTITGAGGCDGSGESGFYVVSRLDAHDTTGISKRLRKKVGALWKRPGTVDEPVIVVDGGGEANTFYGVVCEKTNTWTFTAKYDLPAWNRRTDAGTRGANLPSTYKWQQEYRHAWYVGEGSISSGSQNSPTITATFPAGQHQVTLVVYRRAKPLSTDSEEDLWIEYTRARIRYLAVEEQRAHQLARAPAAEKAPMGTPFQLTNTNRNGYTVDARLGVMGAARARVSLDGYPQNEYWGGATDSLDYKQALGVPDEALVNLWLQGYDSASSGEDDTALMVEGQELIEQCLPIPCHGAFAGNPVKVSWVGTDREPFAVWRLQLKYDFPNRGKQVLRGMMADALSLKDGAVAEAVIEGPAPTLEWGKWDAGFKVMAEYRGADLGTGSDPDGRFFTKQGASNSYCPPIEHDLAHKRVHSSFPERPLLVSARPSAEADGGPAVFGFTLTRTLVLGVNGIGDNRRTWQGNRLGLPNPFGNTYAAEAFLESFGTYLAGVDYGDTLALPQAAADLATRLKPFMDGPENDLVALKRADLLCHSYGGLVSRWHAEQGPGAASVRKIVTIASPHWGSPAANLLLDGHHGRFDFCDMPTQLGMEQVGLAEGNYGANCTANDVLSPTYPGVVSLTYKSPAISSLNATPFHKDIAYASITGTDDDFFTLDFFYLMVPLAGTDRGPGSIHNGTPGGNPQPGEHRAVFPWIYALDADQNDMMVPTWSGRLPAANQDVSLTHGEVVYCYDPLKAAQKFLDSPTLPKGSAHRKPFLDAISRLPYVKARDQAYAAGNGGYTNRACWNLVEPQAAGSSTAGNTLVITGMRGRATRRVQLECVVFDAADVPSGFWDVNAPWGKIPFTGAPPAANELEPFVFQVPVDEHGDPRLNRTFGPAYFGSRRPTYGATLESLSLKTAEDVDASELPGSRTSFNPVR